MKRGGRESVPVRCGPLPADPRVDPVLAAHTGNGLPREAPDSVDPKNAERLRDALGGLKRER